MELRFADRFYMDIACAIAVNIPVTTFAPALTRSAEDF